MTPPRRPLELQPERVNNYVETRSRAEPAGVSELDAGKTAAGQPPGENMAGSVDGRPRHRHGTRDSALWGNGKRCMVHW